MGMFDYIKVKMPLPDTHPKPNCEWFQTKFSDHPYLEKYVIEEDGRLTFLGYRVEDRGDKSEGASPSARLAGCMTHVYDNSLDEVIPYHGDILFGEYDDKTGEDWDYIARFADGVCVRIWCEEYSPPRRAAKEAGE